MTSARSNSDLRDAAPVPWSRRPLARRKVHMPCGSRARLTAYVAYQTLAFAERDVLLAALADAGYSRVETAPAGTDTANPVPVLDSDRRIVGGAAMVVRREHLAMGFGDLGFVLTDGAYVPLVP